MPSRARLRELGVFDARAPRYTSYPPANHFAGNVTPDTTAGWIEALPSGARVSLYLHIPYCRRLCWFCACRTQGTATDRPLAPYQSYLKSELALVGRHLRPDVAISSIHLGGGTPTLLPPDLIRELGEVLHAFRPWTPDAQFSVEIDPTEVDAPRIAALKEIGMTRASIGVQDFDPLVQESIGREQGYELTRDVVAMLRDACDACAGGAFDALVTAPVQKSAILDAGVPFTGHTEFFAERTGTPRVVMMLAGGAEGSPLRVALVTTHLPLSQVPAAITRAAVRGTIAIVAASLVQQFAIAAPRIAVCGLNPHAGEGGHLGREDIDAIAPAIADARADGIDARGPVPADTVFVPSHARDCDAIVAMYHDQGLPVLKAASFGHGVNVTLGLPFPRTSVDHGTALDLAADDARAASADPGSLFEAVDLAIALAHGALR